MSERDPLDVMTELVAPFDDDPDGWDDVLRRAHAEGQGPEPQFETDALLRELLASPVKAPRVRSRRRLPQLAAATVLVAAAMFAALSLLDSDEGPTTGVVAKALAALTQPNVIYHSIARMHAPDTPELVFESWHTTSGRLHQRTFAARDGGRGRLYVDFAGRRRPGRLGGPTLAYDPRANTITQGSFRYKPHFRGPPGFDPFDPARSLRELRAEGRLRVAGRVEVDGKPAYRLVSGDVPGSDGYVLRSEFIVDAGTYLPREERVFVEAPDGAAGSYNVIWRFPVYERLPLNDETRSLLDFDPPADATCAPGAGPRWRAGELGFPNPCAQGATP